MTGPSPSVERDGAGTVAAIMAAVLAYLDEERQAVEVSRRSSAWKVARWESMRGETLDAHDSWTGRDPESFVRGL